MDDKTTVADLRAVVDTFGDEREWGQFHDPKNLAEAISIEASELLEHFLWKTKEDVTLLLESDAAYREEVSDEFADVLGYVLRMARALNIDASEALRAKFEKNAIKYPIEKAKGRATKYTHL